MIEALLYVAMSIILTALSLSKIASRRYVFSILKNQSKYAKILTIAFALFAGQVAIAQNNYTIDQTFDYTFCGVYPSSSYVTGSIVITETSNSGTTGWSKNQTSKTINIDLPAGFEWDFSNENATYSGPAALASGAELTVNSVSYIDNNTLQVNLTTANPRSGSFLSLTLYQLEIKAVTAGASGNILRNGGDFKLDNSTGKPTGSESLGALTVGASGYYTNTLEVAQPNSTDIVRYKVNGEILQIKVTTSAGSDCGVKAKTFTFNTSSTPGSTSPVQDNVGTAKIWYTGSSSTFATTTYIGQASITADGSFSISYDADPTVGYTLSGGDNYFWLTYDIKGTAVSSEYVDAELSTLTLNGTTDKVQVMTTSYQSANLVKANSESLSSASADFAKGDEDFTIGMWINANTISAGNTIFSKYEGSTNEKSYIAQFFTSSQIRFYISNDGVGLTSLSLNTPSSYLNQWNFIVMTYDATNNLFKASVNGGSFVSVAHTGGAYAASTANFILGSNSNTNYYNGYMDKVFFYDKTLSQTEVNTLYNNGLGQDYADVDKTSLVSWWEMDEASGNRSDSHGSNTLTDNNTVGSANGIEGISELADVDANRRMIIDPPEYYSRTTGNWGTGSTWSVDRTYVSCSCTPSTDAIAYITDQGTVTVNADATVASVVIENNGILVGPSSGGTKALTVTSTVETQAAGYFDTGTKLNISTANLTIAGTGANAFDATASVTNDMTVDGVLTINATVDHSGTGFHGTGTITLNADLTLSTNDKTTNSTSTLAIVTSANNDVIVSGVNAYNNGIITLSGGGILDGTTATSIFYNLNGATFNYNSTNTGNMFATAGKLDASAATNTVVYGAGSNMNVVVPVSSQYNNLTYSGGSNRTLAGNCYISGNFTNTACTAVSSGFGMVFNGSANQNLDNTGGGSIGNFTLSNSGNKVILLTNVTIDQLIFLTSGYVDAATNDVTLTLQNWDDGDVSGLSTNLDRFILVDDLGTFRIEGVASGETADFPVGLATGNIEYARVKVAPAAGTDAYAVNLCNYVNSTGTCSGGSQITSEGVDYTWDISSDAGTQDADVTLYWDNSNRTLTNFNNGNCAVNHYDGAAWTALGAFGAATNLSGNVYYKTGTTTAGFSPFGVSSGGGVLPIELVTFEATLNGDQVDLKWATRTEINNDYFTVEKSRNGKDFEEVFTVQGAGNSSKLIEYYDADYDVWTGKTFYRLKQTDFDGRFSYSEVVAVTYKSETASASSEAGMDIYPNPSEGTNIHVDISGFDSEKEILVVVRDITGKEFYSKVVVSDYDGNMATVIDPYENLPVGTYIVTGTTDDRLFSKKLIVTQHN